MEISKTKKGNWLAVLSFTQLSKAYFSVKSFFLGGTLHSRTYLQKRKRKE